MVQTVEQWVVSKPVTRSRAGVVASQNRSAAEAGASILAAGGNAVDAAIATAFALTVTEPWMSGIGGIGAMIVHPAGGEPVAIDYGPVAARALDPARYALTGAPGRQDLFGWPGVVEDRNIRGYESIVVPGSVAGFGHAHARFGRLPWADVIAPAVALARAGHRVDWWTTLNIAAEAHELRDDPAAAARYLRDGLPPVSLSMLAPVMLDLSPLAATLQRIAEAGWEDFYRGDLAAAIASDLRAGGSPVGRDDLGEFAAREARPVAVPRAGAVLHAMPGLFAGNTFARVFAALPERLPGPPAAADVAALARALSDAYAARLAGEGEEDPAGKACTTHLSVVDAEGGMVSLTNTLLSRFGSRVVLPSTGILMNNGMMWFDPRPGHPNSIAPGRRPLTNMCPVIASREGRAWFAVGASGGRKILPAVAQIVSFLVDGGMTLEEAFHHPRIDVSGVGAATVDHRLPTEVQAAVAAAVATVTEVEPTTFPGQFANPVAVLRDGEWNEGLANVTLPTGTAIAG
ncbi:gamma-glutamyltransferase family protein [Alsobacter sp. R-9]